MTCGDKSDQTVKNNLRGNQQYYQDTTKAYRWQREWWGDLKRQKKVENRSKKLWEELEGSFIRIKTDCNDQGSIKE